MKMTPFLKWSDSQIMETGKMDTPNIYMTTYLRVLGYRRFNKTLRH